MSEKHNTQLVLFSKTFYVYVFLCAALPSGMLLGVPVKGVLFLLLMLFSVLSLLKWGRVVSVKSDLVVIFGFFVLTVFYLILGLVNAYDPDGVIEEFKFIGSFIATFGFVAILKAKIDGRVLFENLLLAAIFGTFFFAVAKAVLFMLIFYEVIDYGYVENNVFAWINYTPVGLLITGGGSRLSFVTLDFVAICVFVLYSHLRLNLKGVVKSKVFYGAYLAVLLVLMFSAYSRALFAIFPALLLLSAFFKRNYIKIGFIVFAMLAVLFVFSEMVLDIIDQRFLNQGDSDSWRVLMIDTLTNEWSKSPFVGWGMGAYVSSLIRDPRTPWSYEVQFLSYIYKFGIVFVALYSLLLFGMLRRSNTPLRLLGLTLFIVWTGLSFSNQYLFNTTSSVLGVLIYCIFFVNMSNKYARS